MTANSINGWLLQQFLELTHQSSVIKLKIYILTMLALRYCCLDRPSIAIFHLFSSTFLLVYCLMQSNKQKWRFCRSTTPQQWEDFSRYNVDRAKAEMGASQRLREATHLTIHHCDNDLEAQRLAVDYALRKRIHEAERALDELNWQKKNVSSSWGFHTLTQSLILFFRLKTSSLRLERFPPL